MDLLWLQFMVFQTLQQEEAPWKEPLEVAEWLPNDISLGMSSRALTAARQFNKTQVCQVVDKI
jgi:hypothetical protein